MILSWLLSFKIFENISRGQTIKISLKMGHFSVFLCIGAKPFIIAHHGFHHSVGKGLKYLGYQGYIYAHSPLRGPQLSPKKPRKQYFSRLCQKVDFVGLFSRLELTAFFLLYFVTLLSQFVFIYVTCQLLFVKNLWFLRHRGITREILMVWAKYVMHY